MSHNYLDFEDITAKTLQFFATQVEPA
jgi:hypothetical protein